MCVVGRGSRPDAVVVGLCAVAHVAGDEALMARFVALTGCGADDFRQRVDDPAFLGAVLDFVLQEGDAAVMAVAQAAGIPPEAVMTVRAGLPGGGGW